MEDGAGRDEGTKLQYVLEFILPESLTYVDKTISIFFESQHSVMKLKFKGLFFSILKQYEKHKRTTLI